MSLNEKSPIEKSPIDKSPIGKSPIEKSPIKKSPNEKSNMSLKASLPNMHPRFFSFWLWSLPHESPTTFIGKF